MVLPQLSSEEIYGPAVRILLRSFRSGASEVARTFAERFYGSLMQADETRSVLSLLGAEEFGNLQSRQAQHLLMLLDPELEAEAHRVAATHVGRVHALVGVDIMWLIDAYNLYQQALLGIPCGLCTEQHHQLQLILDRRLLLDLQAQSAGYRQLDDDLSIVMAQIQQTAMTARSTTDLYQGVLKALCAIDGVLVANIGRRGMQGMLELEALEGPSAHAHAQALRSAESPAIELPLDAIQDVDGPSARAWKSGQLVCSDAYLLDSRVQPWRSLGADLGIRSSASLPLIDEAGQTFALVNIYSRWPGFFKAQARQLFLQHVQQTLSTAALRHVHGKVIPHDLRQKYRELIAERRMGLLYQPIIDLQTGALRKVEALGRLIGQDGDLVSPGEFLPTLGNRDLLRLFKFGVEQVCRDLRAWHAQGLRISVSLNLPPQAIAAPEYHEVLFRTLEDTGTDTEFLELEILESQEHNEVGKRDSFLNDLKTLGIRLIQDDLGAGHSSLLRLDSMPFDEVKIDQGLVRRAANRHPHRAFGFIYFLTQLAHELGVTVVVEGLESPGLIEAACIMGADRGQGFGIARPMPAERVAAWLEGFQWAADPLRPRTAWGALAGYLLWERELKALDAWPELIENHVRAPCRVQHFIERHDLRDSALQRLLDANHSVALHGAWTRMYQRSRCDVIDALSEQGRREAAAFASIAR